MRVAVISDIHGNLAALQRVLEIIDTLHVDTINCLGDIVGYGAQPNDCIELVQQRCRVIVRGNHDSGALGEIPLDRFNPYGRSAIRWTRKNLTRENVQFLKDLPLSAVDQEITYAHASLPDPDAWRYVVTWPEARRCFSGFTTHLCFIGHTHVPAIVSEDGQVNLYRSNKRHLVNVGSIGQPRDGNPRAAFGFADTERNLLEIIRVEYDIESSARAILKARLPDYLAQRLFLGI
jgi:diadenosine tetraphosphatase ApaH/serine/threonine PP2A family protein phosphatase